MAKPLPGPRAPALVNALRYLRNPLGYMADLHRRYGDIFAVRFPDFGTLVGVAEPSLVKEVFTLSPKDAHAGEANATVLLPAVGPSSVLTLDEDAHMRQRKLLLAPFHGKAIEHYRAIMLDATRRDLETWPVGEPFAIRAHTQRITLDVIMRAVYGLDDSEDVADAHETVDLFATASDALMLPSWMRRPGFPQWRRFVRARAKLDELVY